MKYNITDKNAPVMPNLGKGTECIKLLLSQVSEDMLNPSFRCFFLYLAHMYAVQNFSTLTSLGRHGGTIDLVMRHFGKDFSDYYVNHLH